MTCSLALRFNFFTYEYIWTIRRSVTKGWLLLVEVKKREASWIWNQDTQLTKSYTLQTLSLQSFSFSEALDWI